MKTTILILILIVLGTSTILTAQVIRYDGAESELMKFSTGMSLQPEMTFNQGPYLNTSLWIGFDSRSETSIPGTLQIDFSSEPFNKRRLGEFSIIKSFYICAKITFVEEKELGTSAQKGRYDGGPSTLGYVNATIEDSDGNTKIIPMGELRCNDSEMTYLYINPEYLYQAHRLENYEKRTWFIRTLWISGVRPIFLPDEIDIYWMALTGD